MAPGKIIVKVNANFDRRDALFTWIKKYAQSYNDTFAFWDEFAFTVADMPETDALVVYNNPSEKIGLVCYPEKVIAFMMEPGIYHEQPWMFKGLDKYAKVYSPLNNSANTIQSHGYSGWYFTHNYRFLNELPVPEKTKLVSCIASDLKQLKGHRIRTGFLEKLGKELPGIDFFGKGRHFIPDKLDGLLPYRFSIAIENTSEPFYFTEKISDCFLAYTVPIYYGCTNMAKYFPEKSFISIDVEQPAKAVEQIREILTNDDWSDRLDAVKEARDLVLHKYQPLAGAADILRNIQVSGHKKRISISPVPPTFNRMIRTMLLKLRRGK